MNEGDDQHARILTPSMTKGSLRLSLNVEVELEVENFLLYTRVTGLVILVTPRFHVVIRKPTHNPY